MWAAEHTLQMLGLIKTEIIYTNVPTYLLTDMCVLVNCHPK